MKHRRILGAAAATAAVSLAVATSAIAAPVDISEDTYEAPVANTIWESSSSVYHGFTIDEATIFADTVDPDPAHMWDGDQVNGDAFDGIFGVWVGDGGDDDDEVYGEPTCGGDPETCSYVVDVTTSGGDTIVQGPPQTMFGLQVAVQHRYYANGDLGRALVSYTNPGATAVAVGTGVYSDYGSGRSTVLEGDFTGDAAVTPADRWIVTGDSGAGGDPVVSTVWWGPQAPLPPAEELLGDGTDYYYDESWAGFNITVQPGQTVYLAFFVGIYGWLDPDVDGAVGDVVAPDGGLAADALITENYAAAVAAATAAAAEFSTFSGRLVAGIPAGAPVLNWGAAPAVPVVAQPAFTG